MPRLKDSQVEYVHIEDNMNEKEEEVGLKKPGVCNGATHKVSWGDENPNKTNELAGTGSDLEQFQRDHEKEQHLLEISCDKGYDTNNMPLNKADFEANSSTNG